jgi:hypothetical protein
MSILRGCLSYGGPAVNIVSSTGGKKILKMVTYSASEVQEPNHQSIDSSRRQD